MTHAEDVPSLFRGIREHLVSSPHHRRLGSATGIELACLRLWSRVWQRSLISEIDMLREFTYKSRNLVFFQHPDHSGLGLRP